MTTVNFSETVVETIVETVLETVLKTMVETVLETVLETMHVTNRHMVSICLVSVIRLSSTLSLGLVDLFLGMMRKEEG